MQELAPKRTAQEADRITSRLAFDFCAQCREKKLSAHHSILTFCKALALIFLGTLMEKVPFDSFMSTVNLAVCELVEAKIEEMSKKQQQKEKLN